MAKSPSRLPFHKLLTHAAELIEEEAEVTRSSNINGAGEFEHLEHKKRFEDLRDTAKALRRAAEALHEITDDMRAEGKRVAIDYDSPRVSWVRYSCAIFNAMLAAASGRTRKKGKRRG